MDLISMFTNRISMWVKYSDYEIRENREGKSYIVPCNDTTVKVYDPFDVCEEMIADALNTGWTIFSDENNVAEYKGAVLEFTRKYGLLGWITSLPIDKDFILEEETYLGSNGALLGKKIMPTLNYIKHFYPFGGGIISGNESSVAYAIGRESHYESVFSRSYSEQLLWNAAFLSDIYQHFFATINYQNPDYRQDELAVMRDKAVRFDNNGISFFLTANQRPEMKWEFDSLKTVLETAYCSFIADEAAPLKMCKHCGRAYYNSNLRSEFCSGKCKNQWNVYKSRSKKTIAKEQ